MDSLMFVILLCGLGWWMDGGSMCIIFVMISIFGGKRVALCGSGQWACAVLGVPLQFIVDTTLTQH